MPQDVTLYKLLISCPGDVKDEIKIINEVVEEFNDMFSDTLGITILAKHWSKSSYPQSGGKPQALLNNQFVNGCDAAVAIFWTRFGSPTDEYGSGTEEEIDIMLKSNKQVFMYFSDRAINPPDYDAEGYKRIQAFREKYKDRGIYETYTTTERFRELFRAHLIQHFMNIEYKEKIETTNKSKLELLGIDSQGKLAQKAEVMHFVPNTELATPMYADKIREMYHKIAAYHVEKRTIARNDYAIDFKEPVGTEDEKRLITQVAEILKIDIQSDFFELGNLCKDRLLVSLGGANLHGSEREIEKYNLIQQLYEMLCNLAAWLPVEEAFSNMNCLKLAVRNCGKSIDEDVEITFRLPREAFVAVDNFPSLGNEEMNYLLNTADMGELFGIDGTAEYLEYYETSTANNTTFKSCWFPQKHKNYSEDFASELNSVFCYSVYPDDEQCILKLKMDYIKHNTAIAFPTIIFVKSKVENIPYKITSKHNPDVIEGKLEVKENI